MNIGAVEEIIKRQLLNSEIKVLQTQFIVLTT